MHRRSLLPILSGLAAVAVWLAPVPGRALDLSEVERQYARSLGPVTYCVDPDWPPYEMINDRGVHEGIAADLLQLATARAGLYLQLVPTANWDESIAASKAGRCDLLSFLNRTPKRDEWLVFTDPIFTDGNVIITREEHGFVTDLAALAGETIVLPTGTSIEERVRRDYPNLSVVTTESEAEAFAMVSDRKADMTLRSLTVAVYTIKKDGWFNLKISGQVPGYENQLRIGVRKENAAVAEVLNRGVTAVTASERARIANRHVAINVQTGIDYDLLKKVVALFSAVLVTSLFWALKLKTINRRLAVQSVTDHLTSLSNRADLSQRFAREVDRARRYRRPFSAILLDIDYFKKVNDEYGHLEGDRLLIDFARIVRDTTRTTGTVGRWGGEEFLVLCPETGADAAMVLADRILDAVRSHAFGHGRCHTVSVGVATLRDDDTLDSLLLRADNALYQAKNDGRDRACAI